MENGTTGRKPTVTEELCRLMLLCVFVRRFNVAYKCIIGIISVIGVLAASPLQLRQRQPTSTNIRFLPAPPTYIPEAVLRCSIFLICMAYLL
jgi:hypothetical protein